MLNMILFDTNAREGEILFLLASRGRHADIPGYQSVQSFFLDKGIVIFSRLDCSPADSFKVGVAGNSLFTTLTFADEIKDWLLKWKITFEQARLEFFSKKEARRYFGGLREETEKNRGFNLRWVREKISRYKEAEEIDLANLRS
ncbi:MAG: hypothetical protein PHC85_02060 [Candidatus Pacebacteria bacterium]|nr:hypothetical protein [Candidatus Paceibacterota bacterium]